MATAHHTLSSVRDQGFGTNPIDPAWKPLHFLNLYRITLSGLFVVLIFSDTGSIVLGKHAPELFKFVSLIYLFAALFFSFAIRWRWATANLQTYVHVVSDIIAITFLTYASGGVSSGLGMLLVVAVAGGSILVRGKVAIQFAALATIAILLEETYAQIHNAFTSSGYTHAGILGAVMFASATLAYVFAERIRKSEALAAQRGVDLADMEQLNDYIIQNMQTGIMVIDPAGKVRLINESAWHLLGMPAEPDGRQIDNISSDLGGQLKAWQKDSDFDTHKFRASDNSIDVLPRFARLGKDSTESGVLVFLEDTSQMAQRAQQLKLASLGRLTASIAHEIRNPLGALSHASQLLKESDKLIEDDQRLTDIILNHSKRMNDIIENIMQLSRRDRANPEIIKIQSWLNHFVEEYARDQHINPEHIRVYVDPDGLEVRMDTSQLHQILRNLCDNGLHHSTNASFSPKLELTSGMISDSNNPFLDIIDNGPGIDTETAGHIFDPFFTTENKGTGLGLYIARELCEGNRARLDFIPTSTGGACFRITFADPRRRQIA